MRFLKFKSVAFFLVMASSGEAHSGEYWRGFSSVYNGNDLSRYCDALDNISPLPLQSGEFHLSKATLPKASYFFETADCDASDRSKCISTVIVHPNKERFAVAGKVANGRVCVTSYKKNLVINVWMDAKLIRVSKVRIKIPSLTDWVGTWRSVVTHGESDTPERILVIKRGDLNHLDVSLYMFTGEVPYSYVPLKYGGVDDYKLNVVRDKDMILFDGDYEPGTLASKVGTKLSGQLIDNHLVFRIQTRTGSNGYASYYYDILVKVNAIKDATMLTKPIAPPI